MLPIDVETIRATVILALEIPLSKQERARIDTATVTLIGRLELLLHEDLGFDQEQCVRDLYKAAYRLLDLGRRPTAESPTFGAWAYMRDVAGLTKRLADVYADLHGEVQAMADESEENKASFPEAEATPAGN
jgi:hypothetical protein